MRLLDLFCGAGGCSMGYSLAGFDVTGVDLEPQPNYPFPFIQADAMEVDLAGYDIIHASPPCQAYAGITDLSGSQSDHPALIAPIRERLKATGVPYIIENVESARPEMVNWVRLCGSSFGLDVQRHRLFECGLWYPLGVPPCAHHWQTKRFPTTDSSRRPGALRPTVGVHGHPHSGATAQMWEQAMGIDWMHHSELAQAIPPAYTEWLGQALRLMGVVR
jgi:DNA (cytosine-5)-methyltransferase 1